MSEEEAAAAPEPVEEVEMSVLDALKDVSRQIRLIARNSCFILSHERKVSQSTVDPY
jgi:hypothetical protein